MNKKYIQIVFILLVTGTSVFPQINLYLKPSGSIFFPSSENVRGYYDSKSIFAYGAELNAITDFYGLGLYINYSGFKVDISDPNQINGSWEEKSTLISFGLLKNIDAGLFSVNAKAGVSIHSDDLALGDNKSRYGFRLGADVTREIFSRLGIFIGLEYDYNKLSVPQYFTFAYSRHNAYFSGQTVSTGGIFINAGIYLRVF